MGKDLPRRSAIEETFHRTDAAPAGRDYWDEVAISQIPPYVFVASKNGAVGSFAQRDHPGHGATWAVYLFHHDEEPEGYELAQGNEGWILARKLHASVEITMSPVGLEAFHERGRADRKEWSVGR